jgi:hypothetical protein
LRYYADLARFATIYNTLTPILGLRRPIRIHRPNRRLDEDTDDLRAAFIDNSLDGTPLEAGLTRRGASRVPQPAEVIQILLAIADRTLQLPVIRNELESTSGELEARRQHAIEQRAENTGWESRKKALGDARVQCKTAADTKANKVEVRKPHIELYLSLP